MRKETEKYFFSVEGDCERSYFKWLEKTINTYENRKHNVSFDIKKTKSPISRAKGIARVSPVEMYHIIARRNFKTPTNNRDIIY